MERYSRGRRGAPAKGVVQQCSPGSNPGLSATSCFDVPNMFGAFFVICTFALQIKAKADIMQI